MHETPPPLEGDVTMANYSLTNGKNLAWRSWIIFTVYDNFV